MATAFETSQFAASQDLSGQLHQKHVEVFQLNIFNTMKHNLASYYAFNLQVRELHSSRAQRKVS